MFLSQVAQALHLQLACCVFIEEHEQACSELEQRSMQSEFQYILNQECQTMERKLDSILPEYGTSRAKY